MIPSTIVPAKEIEISAVVCYRVVFDLGSGGGAAVGLAVAGKMGDLGPTHEVSIVVLCKSDDLMEEAMKTTRCKLGVQPRAATL